MQMNVLRTKQVSHVGSRDDHGQPIAGGNDQKCRRRVGSRSTGIQEPSCADIWTPGRRLWTEPVRQCPASVADFAGNTRSMAIFQAYLENGHWTSVIVNRWWLKIVGTGTIVLQQQRLVVSCGWSGGCSESARQLLACQWCWQQICNESSVSLTNTENCLVYCNSSCTLLFKTRLVSDVEVKC